MDELRLQEYVLTWDGSVLEIFGAYNGRFHPAFLSLEFSDPDRKGRRWLDIRSPRLSYTLRIEPADAAAVQEFVTKVETARNVPS